MQLPKQWEELDEFIKGQYREEHKELIKSKGEDALYRKLKLNPNYIPKCGLKNYIESLKQEIAEENQ